jgi:uncharacterized protein YbaR (Trm112 family)
MNLPPKLRDVLACPACRGRLEERDEALFCPSCGGKYPINDGICDFTMPEPR